MKAIIRGVLVREPSIVETVRSFKRDGQDVEGKGSYMQLSVNELPAKQKDRVHPWNIAVFRTNQPKLEGELSKFYYRNEEKLKGGKHFVEFPVLVTPNPKKDKTTNEVIDPRNGFGGVSLDGEPRLVEASEDELPLIQAALDMEKIKED